MNCLTVLFEYKSVILDLLLEPGVYDLLEEKSKRLCEGLEKNTRELGLSAKFTRVGSMFSIFFTDVSIENFQSVKTCNTEFFKCYFRQFQISIDSGKVSQTFREKVLKFADHFENCIEIRKKRF